MAQLIIILQNVVLYTRVSTPSQMGPKHLSMEHQLEKAKQYIQCNDYYIREHFTDEGKSARTIKGRKGLQNALTSL